MGGIAVSVSSTLFFIVEIIGTAAFSLSGAMTGLKYKLDVFGIVFLGVVTALGGGCTRDIILGRVPPAMFRDYRYMLVAVLIALLAFLAAKYAGGEYHKNEEKLSAIANVFDAAGLGTFVVVGMEAGISAGYGDNGFFLVFLGLITCIGGGLLRDLFVVRMSGVLHKHVYALPCILGGVLYLILIRLSVSDLFSIPVVIVFIFTFRMLATRYHWNLPRAE